MTADPGPSTGEQKIIEYAVEHARYAARIRELTEELVRTRAALIQTERELAELKTERRGRGRRGRG